MIFAFSKSAGGILFGIAFWIIARRLGDSKIVREYMIISAYGLVVLLSSLTMFTHRLDSSRPPSWDYHPIQFWWVFILQQFLYLETQLRQSIRKLALKETKLLDSIGTAQMQGEIESMVLQVAKEQEETLKEQTGVQPSLSEEEDAIQKFPLVFYIGNYFFTALNLTNTHSLELEIKIH